MALTSGTHVGPYEILSPIGAGGMGEVYRARDPKLGRDVAVKVLPEAFTRNADRMARFHREARLLASLNHPNIASIHGFEDSSDIHALVMELVEGQTLADRIRSSSIPIDEALQIARQIAEGLEYAHEHGVVHRDLKPSNIKLASAGTVKILDFGLAKAIDSEVEKIDIGDSPTISRMSTQGGIFLGTPAYMSPEQTKDKPVDKRTDIWAFGCVLFEMFTGRSAFPGDTLPDTIAAVLEREPDWQALPPEMPVRIRDLLKRCLQKDPRRRLRDIGDARIEIDDELARFRELRSAAAVPHRESGRQVSPPVVAPKRYAWLPWTLLALLVVGFGVWIIINRTRPAGENPLLDAQFTPLTDVQGVKSDPAISPDGKFVAFISDRTGTFDIWVIQANGSGQTNLTQGRFGDMRAPVRAIGFSADGSEVWSSGTQDRRLRLWPLMGGMPHNFLDEHAAEVAWSPDGARLVYHTWEPGDPTFVADQNGANPRQIVQNEPGLHNHYPTWSKDGRWIYLVRGRPATNEMDLWRISPDGSGLEQLTRLNTDIAYPTPIDERTVLFVAHSESGAGPWLWACNTESRTSRRVSLGVEQYAALAATADGRRLAASVANPQVNLWSVPITSRIVEEDDVEPFQLPTMRALAPRFGGGSLFYLSSRNGADGLWSYHDGQVLEIWKGSEGALHSPPAVSADGKNVAFALRQNEKQQMQQMQVMATDGTRLRALSSDVDVRGAASWSPDGNWIVVAGSDRGGAGLFKLPVHGGSPVRIATGPFLDPVWSPRGDLIVYCGTQVFTFAPLLAVHPDGTPAKLPEINVQRDGERVRFLPDGTGLVYMLGSTLGRQDFWLLDLRSMRSRRLTQLSSPAVMRAFDVTPDGRRVVFDRLRENSEILLIDLAVKPNRSD